MKAAKLVLVLLLLLLVASVAGCGKKETATTEVPAVTAQQSDTAAKNRSYDGIVRGRYETNLSFQVDGTIVANNVQVGTPVRSGDVLMLLDAKGETQQAGQGDAQVESAKAQLSLAQSNLKQYTKLYQQNEISSATLEQYQASYDAAFATYQNALAQAAQGRNASGYTSLTAGANGTISSVQAEEGQTVQAGQTVLTLMQTNELEVELDVPKDQTDDFTIGLPVTVSFAALSESAEGIVREVAPMMEGNNGLYRVRISVAQPPDGMKLGMKASVSLGGE